MDWLEELGSYYGQHWGAGFRLMMFVLSHFCMLRDYICWHLEWTAQVYILLVPCDIQAYIDSLGLFLFVCMRWQRARRGAVVRIYFCVCIYVQRSTLPYTMLALIVYVCMYRYPINSNSTQQYSSTASSTIICIYLYIYHNNIYIYIYICN